METAYEPTAARLFALLAATDCLVWNISFGEKHSDRRGVEGYCRLVDTLDSLGWINLTDVDYIEHAEPSKAFEAFTIAGIRIYSPAGCTPLSDRRDASEFKEAVSEAAERPEVPAWRLDAEERAQLARFGEQLAGTGADALGNLIRRAVGAAPIEQLAVAVKVDETEKQPVRLRVIEGGKLTNPTESVEDEPGGVPA